MLNSINQPPVEEEVVLPSADVDVLISRYVGAIFVQEFLHVRLNVLECGHRLVTRGRSYRVSIVEIREARVEFDDWAVVVVDRTDGSKQRVFQRGDLNRNRSWSRLA